MMHVPHQMVCTFVLNLQHIYAPKKDCSNHSHEMIKFVYLFLKCLEIRIIMNE